MKNPLNKRLFRELRTEFGKYAVIFLFMIMTIGLESGDLVASDSMIAPAMRDMRNIMWKMVIFI